MTDFQDYMNTHKTYPDDISRRIDIAPGFDSVRPAVKESLTTECDYCNGWKINSAYGIRQDKAGRWCLEIPVDHCEYVVIQNIKFCPDCGRKLEESK